MALSTPHTFDATPAVQTPGPDNQTTSDGPSMSNPTNTGLDESDRLTLSAPARERLRPLLAANPTTPLLRLSITGGGCAGLQYLFDLAERAQDDLGDRIIQDASSGMRMVVDAVSWPYVAGGRVDYREENLSGRFVLDHPDMQATCGCGSSFQWRDH